MNKPLRAVDIIALKRDAVSLAEDEISFFVKGFADGSIPDYQAAAWCMAVFLNGMTADECGFLTRAMIDSGDVIDLDGLTGPFTDKHSTGGVGDKISLILAPVAAACGLKVPMMSGRALGHTGGTLDKLDSIPGYTTALSTDQFKKVIKKTGYAMTGQSEKIVPADRKMYALRDVIASVESVPLITASILSKKFAEGAQSLVMDVKCGRGAFMKSIEDARVLARSLVRAGQSLGRPVTAVLTDMSQPLGHMVGNFLEVEESIACLRGEGPDDVMEVTLYLSAGMLVTAGLESGMESALERCRSVIQDGSAMRHFRENVAAQGGRPDELDRMCGQSRAACSRELRAGSSGFVSGIDAFAAGMAAVSLGVGRNTAEDKVEALAGIEVIKKTGDAVNTGETLMRLWAEDPQKLDAAEQQLSSAVEISTEQVPAQTSLILEEIS